MGENRHFIGCLYKFSGEVRIVFLYYSPRMNSSNMAPVAFTA